MNRFALITVVLAIAAFATLPGRAADETRSGSGIAADGRVTHAWRGIGVCENGDCPEPAAALSVPASDVPQRLDDRTRDMLIIAALICLLLASFLLNARAFSRPKRRKRSGAAHGRRPRPRTPTPSGDTPVAP